MLEQVSSAVGSSYAGVGFPALLAGEPGHPKDRAAWAEFVPGLKSVEDSAGIHHRTLLAFEYAESEPDPAERARLLTFVVVGGGPKGVEMAGDIAELASRTLSQGLYSIAPEEVQVVLVEPGSRLLPGLQQAASDRTSSMLEKRGVAVRLGVPVAAIASDHVMVGDERIEARTAIWAAGGSADVLARIIRTGAEEAGASRFGDLASMGGWATAMLKGLWRDCTRVPAVRI